MKQQMSEFDVVYISYDEPKCEENWANLLQKAPWAKRVHGVKGFDAAHKEAARLSETDRVITIDGDNIIDEKFFDMVIDIPEKYEKCALSWNARNVINGLVYGNGGVKLWPREWILNMRTHEAAEGDEYKVDFCWDNTYLQLNSIWSTTYPNGSAFQAFRAGFREGCKMTLDVGAKVDPVKMKNLVHDSNFKRLMVWCCVGADTENGLEAIFGARLGIYMTNIATDFDIAQISDYDWFKEYGNIELAKYPTKDLLIARIEELGAAINGHMGLNLCMYDEEQSKFFKSVYEHREMEYAIRLEKEILGV
jgi:hypothetical protein